MPDKPLECLHCAIAVAVNEWADAHCGGKPPEGVNVLVAFEKNVAELLSQIESDTDRLQAFVTFTKRIAGRLGCAQLLRDEPEPEAPLETGSVH